MGRSDLPSVADSPLCIVPPADAVTVVRMIHPFIAVRMVHPFSNFGFPTTPFPVVQVGVR